MIPARFPTVTRPLTQRGDFAISQSIPPGDTEFIIGTLNRDDYAYGHIEIFNPHSISNVSRRGMGGYIEITRDIDEAYADLDRLAIYSIPSYPAGLVYSVYSYWQRFRRYAISGYLSENFYHSSGGASSIKSCVIDGDEIKLVMRNSHGSVNSNIQLVGYWKVEGVFVA